MLKQIPEDERLKRIAIIKDVISIILYFVMLNNPGKSKLIKFAMRIFGISEEKIIELDEIMNELENTGPEAKPEVTE